MLNVIGFIVFCIVVLIALYFQGKTEMNPNRLPLTPNLALGDVFVAVNVLQDLLDSATLSELSHDQVHAIRSAQFKLDNAIAAYTRHLTARGVQ